LKFHGGKDIYYPDELVGDLVHRQRWLVAVAALQLLKNRRRSKRGGQHFLLRVQPGYHIFQHRLNAQQRRQKLNGGLLCST
jgi:hypothetical protein